MSKLKDAPDELVGKQVAGFLIQRLLGHGGMGKVYKAEQVSVGRYVALKVLKDVLQEDDRVNHRFAREAQAIAQLNHPNIVTLYDFGTDKQISFIAMEYVEGHPLSDFLGQPLEINFITQVFRHILAALSAAHERGIVHRDLKPDNVMLTTVGADKTFAKVLDFGLARLTAEDDMKITHAGEVFGTPLYMSPEQASGEDNISPTTDLYSLGCMIYELIMGQPPFLGRKTMHVLMKHVHDPVPPLIPRPGLRVSEAFKRLILDCLKKSPDDRPPSAKEVLERLHLTPEAATLTGLSSPAIPSVDDSLKAALSHHSLDFSELGADDPYAELEIEEEIQIMTPAEPSLASMNSLSLGPNQLPPSPPVPRKTATSLPTSAKEARKGPGLAVLMGLLIIGVAGAWLMGPLSPFKKVGPQQPQLKTQRTETKPSPTDPHPDLMGPPPQRLLQEITAQAQRRVDQGVLRALDGVHRHTIATRFGEGLRSVELYKTTAHLEYRPLLINWSWPQSVHHRHIEVVPASRYVDPLLLLFGE